MRSHQRLGWQSHPMIHCPLSYWSLALRVIVLSILGIPLLSSLSFCPIYPWEPKQESWRNEKASPAVKQIYLFGYSNGKRIRNGEIMMFPFLVISTTIAELLQILAVDNGCNHSIILWKYNRYISNVSVYNTLDVHCQSPCGLSMWGFSRDWQCQIRSFALTGEHGINSMSYDTIKSKPLVFSGVQEPHMNSSLKDQMSSSLSPQKSGFGLDLLLKTVICSNEVLWRLSYCPWGLLCHMYSKFMASKVALVKKICLKINRDGEALL